MNAKTTATFTLKDVTDPTRYDVVDYINKAASDRSQRVFVNGEELFTSWRAPAMMFGNGTLALDMKARTVTGRPRTDHYKVGATVTVETFAR